MAHRGRRNADDVLALELAAGKTLRDAALAAGIAERTATRRWADPEFRRLVSRHRGEMVGRAVGELADGVTDAAKTLRELLACKSLAVRLGADRECARPRRKSKRPEPLISHFPICSVATAPRNSARG